MSDDVFVTNKVEYLQREVADLENRRKSLRDELVALEVAISKDKRRHFDFRKQVAFIEEKKQHLEHFANNVKKYEEHIRNELSKLSKLESGMKGNQHVHAHVRKENDFSSKSLEQKAQYLNAWESSLSKKESELNHRDKAFSERHRLFSKSEHELISLRKDVLLLQTSTEERAKFLHGKELELGTLESSLAQRAHVVKERESQLLSMVSHIRSARKQFDKQQSEISHQLSVFEEEKRGHDARCRAIEHEEKRLKQMHDELVLRERAVAHISVGKNEVARFDHLIAAKKKMLSAVESELKHSAQKLADTTKQLRALQMSVDDYKIHSSHEHRRMSDYLEIISTKETLLRKLEEQLMLKEHTLTSQYKKYLAQVYALNSHHKSTAVVPAVHSGVTATIAAIDKETALLQQKIAALKRPKNQ